MSNVSLKNPFFSRIINPPEESVAPLVIHELRLEVSKNLEFKFTYEEEKGLFSIDVINPLVLDKLLDGVDGFSRNVILAEIGVVRSIVHMYYNHYLEYLYVNKIFSVELMYQLKHDMEQILMRDYGGYSPEFVLQYIYRSNLLPYEAMKLDQYIKNKGDN